MTILSKDITQTFDWKHREEDFQIVDETTKFNYKLFGFSFFKKTVATSHGGNYALDDNVHTSKPKVVKGFGQ